MPAPCAARGHAPLFRRTSDRANRVLRGPLLARDRLELPALDEKRAPNLRHRVLRYRPPAAPRADARTGDQVRRGWSGIENSMLRHTAPVMPPRSNREAQLRHYKLLYRERNRIERRFGRLKDFRRIAKRFDHIVSHVVLGAPAEGEVLDSGIGRCYRERSK